MTGTRHAKGKPEREIYNLFATLNQEQQREKHDISGFYEGRLRSHVQNFEGMKRKWEGFTGVPVPKKLRTSEADMVPVREENAIPNQHSVATEAAANPVAKSKVAATAKKVAPATMPPHPDDKINVDRMLVNDLRKELRRRGLIGTGRKAELQARLKQHLAEAKRERDAKWAANYAVKKKEVQIKHVKIGNGENRSLKNKGEMDVVMEDASEASANTKIEPEGVKPLKKAPVKPTIVGTMQNNAMKNQAPKSALKPSKYASTIVQSSTQIHDVKPAVNPEPSSSAEDELLAHKVSDSSSESSYEVAVGSKSTTTSKLMQASEEKGKVSSTLAPTAPGGSAFKAKVGGTGSAKLLEKKKAHAAAMEARKARMAEMRQKAKPSAANVSSATKPSPSHSKYAVSSTLKKMASGSTLGESKSNDIRAKMREKAAADKNTENMVAPPTKPAGLLKQGSSSSISVTSSLSTVKQVSQMATYKPAPKSTALKSILDPSNRPAVSPSTSEPVKEKPLSPIQTYEMSDREEESSESESDSDDEYERQRPKKSIPDWAQKANLHRALERQFADGPERLDPDKIFGEVITCNLEEIFDKKKSRYQRRTSSGNWTKDHVTLAEKRTYKRTMGYD